MRKFFQEFLDFFRKGDLVLLALCLLTTAFGLVAITSATNFLGAPRFIIVQIVATVLGIGLYAVISSIDLDLIMEYRVVLVIFNCVFLLMLIPFGVDYDSGNKSWLDLPGLPFDIQVAEIIKTTYILIMASVMNAHQNRLSKLPSVVHMMFHLGLLVGMNMVLSGDAGVSLIFVFIFIGMTFTGGVHRGWFILAIALIAVGIPIVWPHMPSYMRARIEVLFDPSIDPTATGVRWQTNQAMLSLTAGGFSGQGLFNGARTSIYGLTAQHTDFIYSAIGEEMGFLGCLCALVLELAIIARVVYVGTRTPDFARKVVCFGAASALIFQVISNVGMNLGVMPVIGLTLPFISYGGSSILSLYAMLGLVSGVCARPTPGKQGLYIQPPR